MAPLFSRGAVEVGSETDAPGSGGTQGAGDLSAVREEVAATRKVRRDKGTRRTGKRDSDESREVTQEEIDSLFEKENWEALASLYFDTRFVMTGYENFRLTEVERKRLAQTMATTMKVLLHIDPAYVAVIVFTVNFGGTIASKEAAYADMKRKKEASQRGQQRASVTSAA